MPLVTSPLASFSTLPSSRVRVAGDLVGRGGARSRRRATARGRVRGPASSSTPSTRAVAASMARAHVGGRGQRELADHVGGVGRIDVTGDVGGRRVIPRAVDVGAGVHTRVTLTCAGRSDAPPGWRAHHTARTCPWRNGAGEPFTGPHRRSPWGRCDMHSVVSHIRYGVRMLIRRPGLAVTAVTSLALGIGLTTTMFSIVYVAVLRGLPFEDADDLVGLFRNRPAQGADFMGISIHDFQDWRAQQTSFEDIAAYYAETVNVGGTEGRPIRYLGAYASAGMFDVLRRAPDPGAHVPAGGGSPVHPARDGPQLSRLAGPIPGRPGHHRADRPRQRRGDHDRRGHAGEVRISRADGRVAAAPDRPVGLLAQRRPRLRGHPAPGRRPAERGGHDRRRAGRDGGDCRTPGHRLPRIEPGHRRHDACG